MTLHNGGAAGWWEPGHSTRAAHIMAAENCKDRPPLLATDRGLFCRPATFKNDGGGVAGIFAAPAEPPLK